MTAINVFGIIPLTGLIVSGMAVTVAVLRDNWRTAVFHERRNPRLESDHVPDLDVPLALKVWAATHYERLDARECSLRFGIPKPRVLGLLAEYRPVAEAAEFEIMRRSKGPPDPAQPAQLARQRVANARIRATAKNSESPSENG